MATMQAHPVTPLEATSLFAIDGSPLIESLGRGLINQTYAVSMDAAAPRYVLQQINTKVFTNTSAIEHNLETVCKILERCAITRGEDPERDVLRFVRTPVGRLMARDDAGFVWRMSHYVQDSIAVDAIDDATTAYRAAARFGCFLSDLWDVPADGVKATIPGFHDSPARLAELHRALRSPDGDRRRLDRARDAISDIEIRDNELDRVETGAADGTLSRHVCHFDTKISNVLLDRRSKLPLCVIDLDTIGPGSPLLDIGDLLRTGAASANEEEQDHSLVAVNIEYANAIIDGFLSVLGDKLGPVEREFLTYSGWLITIEQAIRYLTDYLQDDRYYGARFPEQNLLRATNQLALAKSMEESLPIPGLHIS